MRGTSRLLASAAPAKFLRAGAPTGLTGLFTHPAPRSRLIFVYNATLQKLQKLPESSVYRTSVEGLTKHRLAIVESTKPEGYDAWVKKAKETLAAHPDVFNAGANEEQGRFEKHTVNGITFVTEEVEKGLDELADEWDGEEERAQLEGIQTTSRRAHQQQMGRDLPKTDVKTVKWENEPPLSAQQIGEIENKIGAGLIEEVIAVAEAENQLIDVMAKHEVWADLEESPAAGQWEYFKRADRGTPETQQPPKL